MAPAGTSANTRQSNTPRHNRLFKPPWRPAGMMMVMVLVLVMCGACGIVVFVGGYPSDAGVVLVGETVTEGAGFTMSYLDVRGAVPDAGIANDGTTISNECPPDSCFRLAPHQSMQAVVVDGNVVPMPGARCPTEIHACSLTDMAGNEVAAVAEYGMSVIHVTAVWAVAMFGLAAAVTVSEIRSQAARRVPGAR